MSRLLLLCCTISSRALVVLPHVSSELGMAGELEVTAFTWVDGAAGMVCHVNTQLVEVEKRLVTLGACVLLLLVLLGHMQSAMHTAQHSTAPVIHHCA